MSANQFTLRVSLSVKKPQLTAKDDKATTDAEAANNANGAGQYRKDLYPKHLIKPIQEVESAARAFIEKHTIENVLPTTKFMWFADELGKYEVQFWQTVTVFLNNWSNVMLEAQAAQGDMFDASLYPDVSALKSRFYWNVNYDTVADNTKFSQIINGLNANEAQRLTAAVTNQVTQQQEAIYAECVGRLKSAVAHIATRMGEPDRMVPHRVTGVVEARPPVYRQPMIDKITEVVDLLEGYASMVPPELLDIAQRAKVLTTHNAETLKNNPDARAETKQFATKLVGDINEMLGIADMDAPDPTDTPDLSAVLDMPSNEQLAAPAPAPVATPDFLMEEELVITPVIAPVVQPVATKAVKEYGVDGSLFDALSELEDF